MSKVEVAAYSLIVQIEVAANSLWVQKFHFVSRLPFLLKSAPNDSSKRRNDMPNSLTKVTIFSQKEHNSLGKRDLL